MNYYKRHVKDYIAKTAHLSLLEHGVYTRLLDIYYEREQPLSRAEAVRFLRVSTDAEFAALDAVLSDFFSLDGDTYVQSRVEQEFKEAAQVAAANKENGKKGGRPRKAKTNRNETGSVISANRTESETKGNPLIHESTNPPTLEQEPAPPTAAPPTPKPERRSRRKPETFPLPDGFAISERVREWAAAKGHHSLQTHFDSFVSKAKAKGYVYADWDEAFMEAVRANWANVGAVPNSRAGPPQTLGKTAQAINQLQAMKDELAQDRTANRIPEAPLLELGPHPGR